MSGVVNGKCLVWYDTCDSIVKNRWCLTCIILNTVNEHMSIVIAIERRHLNDDTGAIRGVDGVADVCGLVVGEGIML